MATTLLDARYPMREGPLWWRVYFLRDREAGFCPAFVKVHRGDVDFVLEQLREDERE